MELVGAADVVVVSDPAPLQAETASARNEIRAVLFMSPEPNVENSFGDSPTTLLILVGWVL
jgi:hypothetical protein